jgi:hypothetical protein
MFRFLENLVDPYQPYAEHRRAPHPALAVPEGLYPRRSARSSAVTAVFSVGNAVFSTSG